MKARILFIFLLLFAVMGVFAQDSVVVLPMSIAAPMGAKKLGTLKAGNNATSNHCNYEATIADAKRKAKTMGGNIVKITKLADPVFIGMCYRIEADVYHADDISAYLPQKTNSSKPDNNKDYASLYIYRLKDTIAFATSYKVHLENDTVICTASSRSHDLVKVYNDGPVKLWAKTERQQDLKLDVKKGGAYYVRCGLKKGEIRMIPYMEIIDNATGEKEYESLKKGKKDLSVNYLNQVH